jgi:hypothetical protein
VYSFPDDRDASSCFAFEDGLWDEIVRRNARRRAEPGAREGIFSTPERDSGEGPGKP